MREGLMCPSYDWDRYIASQEGPLPVGPSRIVRSKQEQRCDSCYGVIPAGTQHEMQAQLDEEGLFMTPLRLHLQGQCEQFNEEY